MAERRMFSKSVTNSARFLRMPGTARLLYYDLGMAADDDGVVEAFTVMRITGAAEDDLRVLAAKGFVRILNRDLVSFITDWRENNWIRADRKRPSVYADLLESAGCLTDKCQTSGRQLAAQDRIGKDRSGKERKEQEVQVTAVLPGITYILEARMEPLNYQKFASAQDDKTREEWFRINLENRVAAYNTVKGDEDGTGVACPVCNNKGTLAFVSPDSGNFTVRPCKCYGTRKTVKRLQKCGVWKQAQRYRLDNFQTDTPTQRAMKSVTEGFLREPKGHWLMLCGQSGAGKTHLCTAAFVDLTYRLGLCGEYFLWNRDGRKLKAAVLEDPENLWPRHREAELLYIDDLFQGSHSEADRRMAFELLDYRYNNDLITILSSELTFDRLLALDEAIAGRIREKCGLFLVNIAPAAGKNYRLGIRAG